MCSNQMEAASEVVYRNKVQYTCTSEFREPVMYLHICSTCTQHDQVYILIMCGTVSGVVHSM